MNPEISPTKLKHSRQQIGSKHISNQDREAMKKFDKHMKMLSLKSIERAKVKLNSNVMNLVNNVVPIFEEDSIEGQSR